MRTQLWNHHLLQLKNSLLAQSDRARVGSSHTTIKGSSIEMVISRTLRDYLPSSLHVGTGQVANSISTGNLEEKLSPQIDIFIYARTTFPLLAVNEDSSVVICCESLYAAIECKYMWHNSNVFKHFERFKKIESKRKTSGERGDLAGYFVFIIDALSKPVLKKFGDHDRFVGVYSLKGDFSWKSPFGKIDFARYSGNALETFIEDILYDCMHKNIIEPGDLSGTSDVVREYFGWEEPI